MQKNPTRHLFVHIAALIGAILVNGHVSTASPEDMPANHEDADSDRVVIERIAPERDGGQAYRLMYRVNVPMSIYWRFKTDFNNTFLISNKFIRDNRFIGQNGNIATTETQYSYRPDVYFRWQTRLLPERFRLTFHLLNPEACGQKYHHGYIQLVPEGKTTRVTQVAYFDFWGAAFWVYNPWSGGMRDFLSYTARWEQETAMRLKDRYREEKNAAR